MTITITKGTLFFILFLIATVNFFFNVVWMTFMDFNAEGFALRYAGVNVFLFILSIIVAYAGAM